MDNGRMETPLADADGEETVEVAQVCEFCLFADPVDLTSIYEMGVPRRGYRLCRLCAETHFAGVYLGQAISKERKMWQSVAYSLNVLRKDIDRRQA